MSTKPLRWIAGAFVLIIAMLVAMMVMSDAEAQDSRDGLFGDWTPTLACESQLGAASPNLFQFEQPTWDEMAAEAGRADLVGVWAGNASQADQLAMANFAVFTSITKDTPGLGLGRWPHCGRYYAGCYTLSGWDICSEPRGVAPVEPRVEEPATAAESSIQVRPAFTG